MPESQPNADGSAAVSLESLLAGMRVVSLPMTVRFRGITEREAALLPIGDRWVEWSPFLEYEAPEASRWLRAALTTFDTPSAPLRDRVPVNATLPAVPADQAVQVLERYGRWRTVKIKVAERGQRLDDDVARVRAVRERFPEARIRIDANGGWDLDQAEAALRTLEPFGLEYAEQPVAQLHDLVTLRTRFDRIPIAADESVRKAEDPLRVARMGAADIVVVKVQPLGGISAALDTVVASGLPAVVSSALDTSVGLAAGVQLAARLPSLDYDCGLSTGALLGGDVVRRRLLPEWDGDAAVLPVTQPEVDEGLLDEFAAADERQQHWRQRLIDCWPLAQAV